MVLVVDLCRLLAQRSASSTPSRDTIDVGKMNNCRPSHAARGRNRLSMWIMSGAADRESY